jgi:hypothetical protein
MILQTILKYNHKVSQFLPVVPLVLAEGLQHKYDYTQLYGPMGKWTSGLNPPERFTHANFCKCVYEI